jgi:membrane protease YdiL (CAAX protease family)
MNPSLSSETHSERHNVFPSTQAISISLAFFLIVVALRSIDAFVLRLDEFPDPYLVSRVFGFLLVLGYLWMLRKPISFIGLHARIFNKAFLIGGLSLLLVYITLYAVQFYSLRLAGETPRLVFGAIDPKTGVIGVPFITLFFLVGQLFNAFMEESIFRGVILPHLMLRFPFWKANLIQALLFGLAHLVFPLSSWASGQVTAGDAIAQAIALLIFTTIGGLVFGYLYYRTDNLWTAIFAHFIDNAIGLFFHILTVNRLNAETDILMLASIGFVALVMLAKIVAKRANLPALRPWGAN